MLAVAGFFGTREDAVRARDALLSFGVRPEELFLHSVGEPLWKSLADVDLPAEEAVLYEPYLLSNRAALIVRTTSMPVEEIDSVIRAHRGVVVRRDVAPPLSDLPLRHSDEV